MHSVADRLDTSLSGRLLVAVLGPIALALAVVVPSVAVGLPGGAGVEEGAASAHSPWRFSMNGDAIDSSSTGITWRIGFGSDYVKERLASGESAIAVDGSTRDTITVTETLGDGMSLDSDSSQWALYARDPATGSEDAIATTGSRESTSAGAGGFELAVTTRGQVATIGVTGPFAPATDYEIVHRAGFTSRTGGPIMGARYSNRAVLNGSGEEASGERSYVEPFEAAVGMDPGFGGFGVVTTLTGSALDVVPASTVFDVRVGYALPAAADAYAGWTAPGTLGDDGRSGSTVMRVETGRSSIFPGTFPEGTTITLSEDLTSASPAPEGYSWGSPSYSVDGVESPSLTIGSRTSTTASLTNRAFKTALGTFQVRQTASGAEAAANAANAVSKEFGFIYDCSDGQFGAVTVRGNDVAAPDKTFDGGTTCTVSEDEKMAAIDGYDLAVPETQTVTIAANPSQRATTVEFVNVYTPAGANSMTSSATAETSAGLAEASASPADPAIASGAGAEPRAQAAAGAEGPGANQSISGALSRATPLAMTGAAVLVPLIIVLVALIGGALLVVRRRGSRDDDGDVTGVGPDAGDGD